MPHFSKTSLKILETCDEKLQRICYEAIKVYDFSMISGHRGEEEQNKLFKEGKSQLEYPDSKHNLILSQAIDLAPWPIDWDDIGRFRFLAGVMFAKADTLRIKLRWGGSWKNFKDYGHYELVEDM